MALAHAARDQLRVLRAEVDDQNRVKHTRSGHGYPFHQGVSLCNGTG